MPPKGRWLWLELGPWLASGVPAGVKFGMFSYALKPVLDLSGSTFNRAFGPRGPHFRQKGEVPWVRPQSWFFSGLFYSQSGDTETFPNDNGAGAVHFWLRFTSLLKKKLRP